MTIRFIIVSEFIELILQKYYEHDSKVAMD